MKRKMNEIKIDKSKHINFSKLQNIIALVLAKYKGIVMEGKKKEKNNKVKKREKKSPKGIR